MKKLWQKIKKTLAPTDSIITGTYLLKRERYAEWTAKGEEVKGV